jgi:GNAT superfamily N-acetyltransferase
MADDCGIVDVCECDVHLDYDDENTYDIMVFGKLAGYFEYIIEGDICYIKQLEITGEESRGRGIGSLALKAFERRMRGKGIDTIKIEDATGTDFWEHRGYVVDESMPCPTNSLGYVYRVKML